MTIPTQAQIEAAAKAIEKVRRCGRFSSCEELAEAAITAAVEVGELEWQHGYEAGMKSAAPAINVLQTENSRIAAVAGVGYGEPQGTGFQAGEAEPAAAEVGEQWKPDIHGTKSEIWDTAEAATVERCAQELDRLMMRAAAAAVRALKDKP